jgi:nitroimidazol reductase NimA-like FMN-containing flavoprotein (pyridoxamine 5'-phosphate oxidase superfamily)
MRRKDREIMNNEKINEIISNCHCCRLGFYDDGEIYIVPLNFGYSEKDGNRTFYFHGAKEGRKIDLISKTHSVGFELDTNYKLNEGEIACQYSARFQSIIGTGYTSFIEDPVEKKAALQAIMLHNTAKDSWNFSDVMLNSVCVFKLEVKKLSCKEYL